MSYSMPKTSVVITIVGCLLVASLFFYFLYMPNRRVLDQNLYQVKELEQKIRVETISIQNLQHTIASFDTQNTRLNYFNQLNMEEPDRIPYLLKSLTREANALGIKFISVDPQVPENKDLYKKYIFKVEVRANYPQMLRFLHGIENKLMLNIDRFSLSQADQMDAPRGAAGVNLADIAGQVTAKIYINTLEMADSQLKGFHSLAQVKEFYLDPNLMDTSKQESGVRSQESGEIQTSEAIPSQFDDAEQEPLIAQAVHRDPFHSECSMLSSSSASLSTAKQLLDKQLLMVKKDDKELVLNAIIDFQEERIAILGQDLVKSGDTVKNTQVGDRNVNIKVLNIGEDTITLGDGQEKYILKLPKNPVQFDK